MNKNWFIYSLMWNINIKNELSIKLIISDISPNFMLFKKKNVIYWNENVNKNKKYVYSFYEIIRKRKDV